MTSSRARRVGLLGLAGLMAVAAWYGAFGMVFGFLPLPIDLVARLPFSSPMFGGIALGVIVAVPSTAAAWLAARGDSRAPEAAGFAGVVLMGWIAVEIAVVRQLSLLQLICALAGAGLIIVGDVRGVRRLVSGNAAALPAARTPATGATVDEVFDSEYAVALYWLPLGAGGHSVRWNGRAYEALAALHEHREPRDLYHSALEVRIGGGRWIIEMAPVWNEAAPDRGAVCQGAVGATWLGRFRAFQYEVRCWRDGRIPDLDEAVDSPQLVSCDPERAQAVLQLVGDAPPLTWGRDELGSGDMWNSNSLVSWLLTRTGHDMSVIAPPRGGRAPGWDAGIFLAGKCVDQRRSRAATEHAA